MVEDAGIGVLEEGESEEEEFDAIVDEFAGAEEFCAESIEKFAIEQGEGVVEELATKFAAGIVDDVPLAGEESAGSFNDGILVPFPIDVIVVEGFGVEEDGIGGSELLDEENVELAIIGDGVEDGDGENGMDGVDREDVVEVEEEEVEEEEEKLTDLASTKKRKKRQK